jgi:hypothetical protein
MPPRPLEGSGIFIHLHNWNELCFPFQKAEVDDDNPGWDYPIVPQPEPDKEEANV